VVEHHLAKVGVAGSNPVVRSKHRRGYSVPRSVLRFLLSPVTEGLTTTK
jgi:hypothetical protein